MTSLGFTAVVHKNKRVGPACLFATKRFWKDTADRKISRLASMLADRMEPLFFLRQRIHQEKKIRRVGGKQAEPGVSSGF